MNIEEKLKDLATVLVMITVLAWLILMPICLAMFAYIAITDI